MHNSPKRSCVQYRVSFCITAALLLAASAAHARTVLSGSIGGMRLTAEEGPYIVEKDIVIPENSNTDMEAGCTFFFKPFTGIIINGNLNVAGTSDSPVLFTSINDSLSPDKGDQLANPFDWNGIYITGKSGKVIFSHFTLCYSVYGIKSQSRSIAIDNGLFKENGQFHFTIMDAPMPVADGIPYSYAGYSITYLPNGATSGVAPVDPARYHKGTAVTIADNTGGLKKKGHTFTGWNTLKDGSGTSYSTGTALVMGNDNLPLYAEWIKNGTAGGGFSGGKNKRGTFEKKGVPVIIGGTGIASGVVSMVFLNKWLNLQDEWRITTDADERKKLEEDGKQSSQISGGSGGYSIAAITTGVILFWVWNRENTHRTAVMPIITPGNIGAMLSINLTAEK